MNLDIRDNKYILFVNFKDINSCKEEEIGKFLKDIFKLLSDIYSIDLFGYFKVDIYNDKKIGSYIEIEKLNDYGSYNKKIDTKVMISNDNFYLKIFDLSKIYNLRNIYTLNDEYYISTKDVDNILDIIEFSDVIYKDLDLSLVDTVKV